MKDKLEPAVKWRLILKTEAFVKEHRKKSPYWFEGIVDSEGEVEVSTTAHLASLIQKYGKTEDAVWAEMPVSAAPIYWLMERTGCIPLYENGFLSPMPPQRITAEQALVIKVLENHGMVKNCPLALWG